MNKKNKIFLIIGLIAGFLIMNYPFVAQVYYDQKANENVDTFREMLKNDISAEDKNSRLQLARAYNEALSPNLHWEDPYSDREREAGVSNYADMLKVKEQIGVVEIPSINVDLPIYAGTSEDVLQEGAGHLEGTSLPVGGKNTHSVITAHRGLPDARLFTDLNKVEIGDVFYIETIAGRMAYQVEAIDIVEPDEIEAVQIQENRDLVTLLTCTPYMINSQRLLVRGKAIPLPEEEVVPDSFWEQVKDFIMTYKWYLLVLILTIIGIILILRKGKKH